MAEGEKEEKKNIGGDENPSAFPPGFRFMPTNDSSLSQPTSYESLSLSHSLSFLSISHDILQLLLVFHFRPLNDELIPTPQLHQALDKALASANQFLTQPYVYFLYASHVVKIELVD